MGMRLTAVTLLFIVCVWFMETPRPQGRKWPQCKDSQTTQVTTTTTQNTASRDSPKKAQERDPNAMIPRPHEKQQQSPRNAAYPYSSLKRTQKPLERQRSCRLLRGRTVLLGLQRQGDAIIVMHLYIIFSVRYCSLYYCSCG